MIANYLSSPNNSPEFDIEIGTTSSTIQQAFVASCEKFVKGISFLKEKYGHQNLNENSLTQEFVAHINKTLRTLDLPICAGREYIDLHTLGANKRRTVDFYFYSTDEETETKSIFSVEAKKLPSPGSAERKMEYVIGSKLNGGIERFKIEEHGKGLFECALLGFVEKHSFKTWFEIINQWIEELTITSSWKVDEKLQQLNDGVEWATSISLVNRSVDTLKLHHFWIDLSSDIDNKQSASDLLISN
jgi:hypothetical protein